MFWEDKLNLNKKWLNIANKLHLSSLSHVILLPTPSGRVLQSVRHHTFEFSWRENLNISKKWQLRSNNLLSGEPMAKVIKNKVQSVVTLVVDHVCKLCSTSKKLKKKMADLKI